MQKVDVTEAKSFLKSKTIIGLMAMVIAWAVQQFFGVSIDEATGKEIANETVNLICTIAEAGGLVLAAYGRVKAKVPIGIKSGPKAATGALLAFICLGLAAPALAGDGSLIGMGAIAGAINLFYALVAFFVAIIAWFWFVDPRVLKGFDTRDEIRKGNRAVGQFAGLSFLGLCILIGLSLG